MKIKKCSKWKKELAAEFVFQKFQNTKKSFVYGKCYPAVNPRKEIKMDELYEILESKIKASGYPGNLSGFELYHDISDLIEGKEEGNYILFSKPADTITYEYAVTIMEDTFNLSKLTITTPDGTYSIDFDS